MKIKSRNLSRNTKSIARRAIVKSALNIDSKLDPRVILLSVKASYKTFKVGRNKLNLKHGAELTNKDEIELKRMRKKEQNIKNQTMYLTHLEAIKTTKASMYVSKEYKENKKLERAIAREKRQTAYQDALDNQKRLSA